ncbi:MAG TPA: GNAT family N-acetyltransferase [Burkholderiaceae bacterium]|nr:GNAT family N-acetyltransferase [Burkholderiaceae bacterium]
MALARERAPDLWPEIMPLLQAHYREIATFQDIALDPDVDAYNTAEAAGLLRCFTARRGGVIVGYAIFLVRTSVHYRQSLQAVEDVLFVDPRYRGTLIGWRLVRYAERALAAEGVQVVSHHVKLTHPALGQLLARLGYMPIETIYVKRLDRAVTEEPELGDAHGP